MYLGSIAAEVTVALINTVVVETCLSVFIFLHKGGDKECTIVQKKKWYRSGGFDVPLFVPHTPNGELAKRMKDVEAQNQQAGKICFKIIEKGDIYEKYKSTVFEH